MDAWCFSCVVRGLPDEVKVWVAKERMYTEKIKQKSIPLYTIENKKTADRDETTEKRNNDIERGRCGILKRTQIENKQKQTFVRCT